MLRSDFFYRKKELELNEFILNELNKLKKEHKINILQNRKTSFSRVATFRRNKRKKSSLRK